MRFKLRALPVAAMLIVLCLSAWVSAQTPVPPVARIEPVYDTMFGDVRVDNYHWLRNRGDSAVIAYIEAENAYTDTVMAHTEALQEKLFQEIKGRIKETDLSVPVFHHGYYYYSRTEEGKQYSIYCRKLGSMDADEEIVLDVNALAEGKDFMDVGTYEFSPDQTMLMYGTDDKGSERYDLRFKNMETGELYDDVIPAMSGNAVWANDNKTVFYTIPDPTWRTYRLYRHTLGDDPANDVLVYEESDERFWIGVGKTRDDAFLVVASGSSITDEWYYLDANNPTGEFRIIKPREEGVEYTIAHHDDTFYIWTNEDGAYNFKLYKTSDQTPGRDSWVEVLPHRENVMLAGVDLFKNHMVIMERENGLQTLTIRNLASGEEFKVDFPDAVYSYAVNANPDFNTSILRFNYYSFLTPRSVFDYNMDTRERTLLKQQEVLGGYDRDEYQDERIMAPARDGAMVPISLVYKKGMERDGSNPLYLYGYGSYGYAMDPYFSTSRLSLLDRGFIFAIPHIRGGDEMGRKWYEDGKLLKKKNTFYDFIDCADYLCDEGYTSHDKLVISGGSAGGLLVGAVVNMRPDLAAVVIGSVPFVDVMNTMLDATIPLTVIEYDEWGNPNVEEYYHYMNSYSPYDNIGDYEYPNMLIQSSLNDTRVQYWEGTKWAAKLRAHNQSDNRLLLKTNMGAGHGGSSGRYDYLHELAFEYAFVLDCLGITE